MSETLKISINKKLTKLLVSKTTLSAFNKEIDKIITSKYKVGDKLKKLKSSISNDNNTITKVRQFIASDVRETKTIIKNVKETRKSHLDQHLTNVPTSFQNIDNVNARNALIKSQSHIKTKNITLRQFPVFYKKKRNCIYQNKTGYG